MSGAGAHRPEVLVDGDPAGAERLAQLRREPDLVVLDQVEGMRAELARVRPAIGPELAGEADRWVHYPWRRTLVRVLGPGSFRRLRLDRNRNKITLKEQERFDQLRIGVVGLSVGHAVAHTLAVEGLAGQLRLADFDDIELSNLNRVPASLLDLGVNKAVVAARRIAELDPYLDVVIETGGVTDATVGRFLDGLDLVIEECDSLDVKLRLREEARARRLPVLMETSDRGLLDVERFDTEADRPIFHGLLDGLDSTQLRGLTTREKAPFVLRLLEPDLLSARLAASMAEIDRTLTTWPQLAGDVMLGAATLAAAVRRFGRDEALPSGRLRIDLDDLFGALAEPEVSHQPDKPAPVIAEPPDHAVGIVADAANRAPSGGNTQPWAFEAAGDELRFRIRPECTSGMDIRFRGSLVAVGAAAFNARVAAAALGRLGPLSVAPDLDLDRPVAVLHLGEGVDPDLAALQPALARRTTNRRAGEAVELERALCARLSDEAGQEGGTVRWVADRQRLAACAEVLAEADRIRFLTPHLHQSMMRELRWPDRDPLETGIDVRTLELDAADLAKLSVARRADVMAKLAEWDGGASLGDGTRQLVNASSALVAVTIGGTAVGDYLCGGAALERLWLAAELAGVALHPVSPLFLFATDDEDVAGLVDDAHHGQVLHLAARLRHLLGVPDDEQYALVLRASRAPEPTVRSGRLPLSMVVRTHS